MTSKSSAITKSATTTTTTSDGSESDPVLDPETVRKLAQLSQQEMADLMGMGLNGYTSWERGERTPGGPAVQLLRLISDNPSGVISVLQPNRTA